ncbi:MAG: hypothetical protein IT448_03920 [Phycisphaerales bacterium]|nr:hypothetical protein [Phycisphaerales bacterium]
MKSTLARIILGGLLLVVAMPSLSHAKPQNDDKVYNARLDTYGQGVNVSMEEGSTALTWMLMIGLGVICFAVLFKDAKRTHLD